MWGAGKGGSGGGASAWHLPGLPWARKCQLLPSPRACPADLEGPEPQGGPRGQMHPGGERKKKSAGGSTSPGAPAPERPFPSLPLSRPPFYFTLHLPLPLPLPPQQASQASPEGPAGRPASLTLGPSVPGVPGRPRAPCRPWAPGEPRSPGKPRSPCGRDTREQLDKRDGVEAQGEAGKWGARGSPGPRVTVLLGALAELCRARPGPGTPAGMVIRTLTLGPTRPGAPASPGTP